VSLILETQEILRDVYESGMEKEKMEERKQVIQKGLRIKYQSKRQEWGGYSGYDTWFSDGLNNAKMASVASYNKLVPGFKSIFTQENGRFLNFYGRIEELSKTSKVARDAVLNLPALD
jgi:predicted aminopeptidase